MVLRGEHCTLLPHPSLVSDALSAQPRCRTVVLLLVCLGCVLAAAVWSLAAAWGRAHRAGWETWTSLTEVAPVLGRPAQVASVVLPDDYRESSRRQEVQIETELYR